MIQWLERWALRRAGKREDETLLAIKSATAKIIEGRAAYEAEIGGPAVKLFAAMMIDWFEKTGAANYVTCNVRCEKTGRRFEITMQRAGGRTPADDLAELRAKA